jgi:hypothetical protein
MDLASIFGRGLPPGSQKGNPVYRPLPKASGRLHNLTALKTEFSRAKIAAQAGLRQD